MVYLPRTLESLLRKAALDFPVISLTGPRQSGKTTLLRHVFEGTPLCFPGACRNVAESRPGSRPLPDCASPPVIVDALGEGVEALPFAGL
jgi:hypothetical protein